VAEELLMNSPMLLIYVAGIIIALYHYQRRQRVSRLVLFALVGLLLSSVCGPFALTFLAPVLEVPPNGKPDFTIFETWFRIANITRALLNAGFFALLLMALFGGARKNLPASTQM
jgi:hypothetical protein